MTIPGEIRGRDLMAALERLGWVQVRQRGSHRIVRHRWTGRVGVVAFHGKMPRRIFKALLKQLDIEEEAFLAAL